MAGGLNQQARSDSLARWAGGAPGAAPTAWFISLHTADPGDTTSIANEATGTGYARVAINAISPGTSPAWAAPTGTTTKTLANANAITFGPSGGAWSGGANLTFFGVCSASSAGNLLARGSLTSPVSVAGTGVTITFATGQLALTGEAT
jgi:hypothetical protein